MMKWKMSHRQVQLTSESDDLFGNDKRQDHEVDKSEEGLTGGNVWDDYDTTIEYSLSTKDRFAQHVV